MSATGTPESLPKPPGPASQAAAAGGGPLSTALLLAGAAFCLTPWAVVHPPLAHFHIEIGLGMGIVLALAGLVHGGALAKKLSKFLIQASVVLLGFRMNLHTVFSTGASGMLFAAGTIAGTFLLGAVLGRWLRTDGKIGALLSSGTAICGGSAIAAVSSVIGASSAQISVATATIFILNGAALYLFPFLGEQMGLSAAQFGTWAGVAIHDVSSVVGAAQSYGHTAEATSTAVDTATVVKLSRVLWIIPICVVAAWWMGRAAGGSGKEGGTAAAKPALRLPIPWFIALFILAAGARTVLPGPLSGATPALTMVAKSGMALALFLIGAGLSRKALATVGWRPLVQGIVMWVAISVAALVVVRGTVD